jgi:hypothetical protein
MYAIFDGLQRPFTIRPGLLINQLRYDIPLTTRFVPLFMRKPGDNKSLTTPSTEP